MTPSVRRLVPGDEALLEKLAREDLDFDLASRGAPLAPLSREDARLYLGRSGVLHWVAETENDVVGHLQCALVHKRAGDAVEVLLYEIGVRSGHRRQGVGRRLMDALQAFMTEHHIREAWVLADNPGAVAFYLACGFETEAPAPTYMTRMRRGGP
jgi:ribosomal protein S18 acetylase RimI-like enzyme